MFVRAPYRLQVGAVHLQSTQDGTEHPETTLKPKHGLSLFLFNNQQDSLIIQIYSAIKLYILTACKWSLENCMKLTSAECTVENS